MRHGLSVTILEIDPAVYEAARTYFGLPDPGPSNVFLEDARAWVAREGARVDVGSPAKMYDIVVHDCFSGGGVPEHIYTVEFWKDLKKVMHSEGILVLVSNFRLVALAMLIQCPAHQNFVGIVKSLPSWVILYTLEHEFRQCRAFHDSRHVFTENDEKYTTETLNIVSSYV
jgi:spermidine synthase